jgi:hypothetical protein
LRRYLKRARSLLHELVWPWCCATKGTLPARWWTQAAFLEPLREWHEQAVSEALAATEATRDARAAFEDAAASNAEG